MRESTYLSDMTDAQWEHLLPLIPPAKVGGRPRTVDIRAVVDAIFYRIKTGCQWRQLPRDFPPWSTAAGYYRIWRRNGTWQVIHDALREQVRVKAGRASSGALKSVNCWRGSLMVSMVWNGSTGTSISAFLPSHSSRTPRFAPFAGDANRRTCGARSTAMFALPTHNRCPSLTDHHLC